MTNEEWLKSLPTEEFAKYVPCLRIGCTFLEVSQCDGKDCDKCHLDWLKQEHKECI